MSRLYGRALVWFETFHRHGSIYKHPSSGEWREIGTLERNGWEGATSSGNAIGIKNKLFSATAILDSPTTFIGFGGSDSLNRNDLGICRIFIMRMQAQIDIEMPSWVFFIFAMDDVPVCALEIILIADPVYLDAGNL